MMPQANLAAGFGQDGIIPLNPSNEHLEALFDLHLSHPDACLIVTDDCSGFLMAALFAHPFDVRMKIAKDTAWFIDQNRRGRLATVHGMIDAYEQWSRERGCQYCGLAGMGKEPRIGKLYERRGYVAAETHYLKKL